MIVIDKCPKCGQALELNPKVYCPDCMWEPLARDPPQSDASAESTFCRACGASIPHRVGEGRCPECMHHLPKPEAKPQ